MWPVAVGRINEAAAFRLTKKSGRNNKVTVLTK